MHRRTAIHALVLALTLALACNGGSSKGGSGGKGSAPPSAQQIVSGGHVASSAHYHVIGVVGEAVAGAGASSSHYRLQGGLAGAQGTSP